jgi:hypothetical protein
VSHGDTGYPAEAFGEAASVRVVLDDASVVLIPNGPHLQIFSQRFAGSPRLARD